MLLYPMRSPGRLEADGARERPARQIYLVNSQLVA
jgi:hypothetical protein